MNEAALDTSALLALMLGEPGAEEVRAVLPGALLSAVNLAELVSKLAERSMPAPLVQDAVEALGVVCVPFDTEQALVAGALRPTTRALGLSLGDRACLALAHARDVPALTSDTAWRAIPHTLGVTVRTIR